MCGIVGHLGSNNSIQVVLAGLKRLEYRGYDSAGISFKGKDNRLQLYKKKGKLNNLEKMLEDVEYISHSCIGHTRWATHGEVTDVNAHPHLSDSIAIDDDRSIAIVHNGIIENADLLRDEIMSHGLKFTSETDSEVFLGLLVIELNAGMNFEDAAIRAYKKIKGNSAFVIQIKGYTEILAIKRGAPLVCGTNKESGDVYVSSDPYALAGFADDLYFPEDDIFCRLSPTESMLDFFDVEGKESCEYVVQKQKIKVEESHKGNFEHYMLKEIYEQPNLVRNLAQYYGDSDGLNRLKEAAAIKPERIHIIGCGTAWHAGLLIKDFCEKVASIPTTIELASEFRYRNPLLSKNDLGLFISQSGETADTLAAQKLCVDSGMRTLSIVNVIGSTLYRSCDVNLLIKAGVEIGVASTKAFTTQVLTGYLLNYALADKLDNQKNKRLFNLLSDRIESLLENVDDIKSIAEKIYSYKGFIFTGRGLDYPIALEGALKLKEIAYVHAEGYAAGELKHGPIALIDEKMVNIAVVTPGLYEKTISNIQEVKARRGVIVVLGPKGDKQLEKLKEQVSPGDMNNPMVDQVLNTMISSSKEKKKAKKKLKKIINEDK